LKKKRSLSKKREGSWTIQDWGGEVASNIITEKGGPKPKKGNRGFLTERRERTGGRDYGGE